MESTLIPFGEALARLRVRLPDTHPDEMAAWIWNGHLRAYRSPRLPACEENRASFLDHAARPEDWRDWWFAQEDIAAFAPRRRYLTYAQLIARYPEELAKKVAAAITDDPLDLDRGLPGIDLLDRCNPPKEERLYSLDAVERFEARRGHEQRPANPLPEEPEPEPKLKRRDSVLKEQRNQEARNLGLEISKANPYLTQEKVASKVIEKLKIDREPDTVKRWIFNE